jgi:hypothetical protein
MKKIIMVFVVGLVARHLVLAQGEITYLSNLGQTPTGSSLVGSDSWIASEIETGSNSGGWPCLDLVDSVGVTHEPCFS